MGGKRDKPEKTHRILQAVVLEGFPLLWLAGSSPSGLSDWVARLVQLLAPCHRSSPAATLHPRVSALIHSRTLTPTQDTDRPMAAASDRRDGTINMPKPRDTTTCRMYDWMTIIMLPWIHVPHDRRLHI